MSNWIRVVSVLCFSQIVAWGGEVAENEPSALLSGIVMSNCGFNATATVLTKMSKSFSSEDLVDDLKVGKRLETATSFREIAAALRRHQLWTMAVRKATASDIVSAMTSDSLAICQTVTGVRHFVVLQKVDNKAFRVYDYPRPVSQVTQEELEDSSNQSFGQLTGNVLFVFDDPAQLEASTALVGRVPDGVAEPFVPNRTDLGAPQKDWINGKYLQTQMGCQGGVET